MTNAHRELQSDGAIGPDPDRDAADLARTLRRSGPLDLGELSQQPDLHDWSIARLEGAVVSAWSHNLIFIDVRDNLVAI